MKFETAIGVGECAGVKIDLIATLLFESQEKFGWSTEMLQKGHYADSIYHSYNVFVSTAKALLLDKGVACNTQISIINDFDKHFVADGTFVFGTDFRSHVLKMNQHEPSQEFAVQYNSEAAGFLAQAQSWREAQKALISDPVSDLAANIQK